MNTKEHEKNLALVIQSVTQVRGLSLELATSLIREQTQKLKSELLNTKEHEKNLALVIQLAVSIIRHGTQGIRSLFGKTG